MTAVERRAGRVALLIDADNLSSDVIEQAMEHLLQNHGAIHFRRAYCSPQKAIELMDLFRRHAIRPMVNVPTGKNSTDIALAVDAIDLALTERPDIVVIASSDSDYAPLAQRLREKGCRVLGIGQAGKTGSESPLAYDGFVDLAHRGHKGRGDARGRSEAPPVATSRSSARASPSSSSRPSPSHSAVSRPSQSPSAAPASASAPAPAPSRRSRAAGASRPTTAPASASTPAPLAPTREPAHAQVPAPAPAPPQDPESSPSRARGTAKPSRNARGRPRSAKTTGGGTATD